MALEGCNWISNQRSSSTTSYRVSSPRKFSEGSEADFLAIISDSYYTRTLFPPLRKNEMSYNFWHQLRDLGADNRSNVVYSRGTAGVQ
jgi:hypothetical protein